MRKLGRGIVRAGRKASLSTSSAAALPIAMVCCLMREMRRNMESNRFAQDVTAFCRPLRVHCTQLC